MSQHHSTGPVPDDGGADTRVAEARRIASNCADLCRVTRVCYWASCGLAPLAFGLWLVGREAWGMHPIVHWGVVAILCSCLVGMGVSAWINESARQRLVTSLQDLVSSQDPAAVGWLLGLAVGCYALEGARWSSDKAWAWAALRPLLSAIGPREASALSARHRNALRRIASPWAYRWARYAGPAALIVAAIEAASRFRDPRYDRGIAALATRRSRGQFEEQVITAARRYACQRDLGGHDPPTCSTRSGVDRRA